MANKINAVIHRDFISGGINHFIGQFSLEVGTKLLLKLGGCRVQYRYAQQVMGMRPPFCLVIGQCDIQTVRQANGRDGLRER